MTETAQGPGETDASRSHWLAFVIFWLGALLYSPLREWAVDRFVITPAIEEAYAVDGGRLESAPDGLLALLPDYPQNQKLLWSLGDLYRKQEHPLLAALYFRAIYHTNRRTGLTPPQREVLEEWLPRNSPADKDVIRQIELLEEEFQKYENEYHVGVIDYPESINGALNRPANQHPAGAGYLRPRYGVPCGPDRPRCGSDFRFSTGRFWAGLVEQELKIKDDRGGGDCCTLRLDDPDLRPLDQVIEDEFLRDPDRMDRVYSNTTQEGRRARLALMSRVMTKQHYVLDFADGADASFSEERPWTGWSWALLVGWFVFSFFADELIHGGIDKLRGRRAAT